MKFKVGDRVQKPGVHWGLGMIGTIVKVGVHWPGVEGSQNEVVWSYPACHTFTQIESDEVLELVEETVAVPRALLEETRVLLGYFDGIQSSRNQSLGVCRAAVHVLLAAK